MLGAMKDKINSLQINELFLLWNKNILCLEWIHTVSDKIEDKTHLCDIMKSNFCATKLDYIRKSVVLMNDLEYSGLKKLRQASAMHPCVLRFLLDNQ